jgi:hypothetical protein
MTAASASPFFMVGPDVETFLQERGLRQQFEEAVEYVRQTSPGLRGIRARFEYDHTVECPAVVIEAVVEGEVSRDSLEGQWLDWRVRHLTPDNFFNLAMCVAPE